MVDVISKITLQYQPEGDKDEELKINSEEAEENNDDGEDKKDKMMLFGEQENEMQQQINFKIDST